MEFCASNGRLQPGFRFHPTNVELVMYYLKKKVLGKVLRQEMIAELDVYKFHPKDLRELARLKKDLNWYFFCPRGKKYACGERTNRATRSGYWKATGNDRVVSYEERTVGKIKTLVFHEGKPPKGTRTDWVMHEYKLEDKKLADEGVFQDSYVLCKIFEKSGLGPKNAEQYGAPYVEEEWDDDDDILNGAQNQCVSVVTNSAVTNAFVSVNGYSGAVSGGVDQAPTSIANAAAANVASSSMGLIPIDYALDQMLTPVSVNGNSLISSPMGSFPNYNVPVVEGFTSMPMAVGIASTSTAPLPINEEDEIDRMLEMFVVGDERDIFGSLEDFDHTTAQGIESSWTNFEGGGFYLSELDELF